jgi:glycosyltransferase involved in cell wall biosynthesis
MEQHLGHQTYYQNLRNALGEALDIRSDWVQITYQDPKLPWEHISFLPRSIKANLTAAWQVRSYLLRNPSDVLFFSTQVPAVYALDSLKHKPAIVATDITPIQYDKMAAFYGHRPDHTGPIKSMKHKVNKKLFNAAQILLPWSNWVQQSLEEDYDVPKDHIEVLPVGVDLTLWNPGSRTGKTSKTPRILFVGGDFERKGGKVLLQAFQKIGCESAELHIVTKQRLKPPPGCFIYTDLEPNSPKLRALYEQADIFVLPSLAEAFGIAAVEASAAGLPSIVTNSGGLPDIVAEGETGFVVPANNITALSAAISRLLDDPERRRKMGRAARRRAETRFDMRKNGARVAELLRQAVM